MADILAPSLALGHAVGRLGCQLNGCCFGRRCDLPWAYHYPAAHETHGAPVHPTPLYEMGLALALAAALGWWFHRRRFDGQVFALYLIVYGLGRGVVELFRGDYPPSTLYFGFLTPAHWISAGLVLAGLAVYWRQHKSTVVCGTATAPRSP